MDAEQGKYKYMFTIIADLKMIIQSCKLYLSVSVHWTSYLKNIPCNMVPISAQPSTRINGCGDALREWIREDPLGEMLRKIQLRAI